MLVIALSKRRVVPQVRAYSLIRGTRARTALKHKHKQLVARSPVQTSDTTDKQRNTKTLFFQLYHYILAHHSPYIINTSPSHNGLRNQPRAHRGQL